MTVTLRDIAKRVGKSVTTVSRALDNYDDVSPETKALVLQVAAEMGYTPSTLAQRLQKQRSETIGLILPTFGPRFSDPFFSEFLAGIGNQAAKRGYDLLVSTRPPGDQEMDAYRQTMHGRQVDGFIILRTRRQDDRIQFLRQANFPFVAFGRSEGPLDYPFVDEDSQLGMRLVAEHLIELGHQRIGLITGPRYLMFIQHRIQGLKDGVEQNGVTLKQKMVREADLTQRGGYNQTNHLLDLPTPPTAIVACNDLMAFGAMSAVQDRGLEVGKDIAVTGFDDIPMAEYSHPPLTTLHQPIYKIGEQVCEMLIRIILGETLERDQIILEPRLVIRQSSGGRLRNSG
ncbi:MAG TPA: LacI family DNA-binding transcriptional regulator [Anaerolineales bacterium]